MILAVIGTRTTNKDSLMSVGRYVVDCINRTDKDTVILSGGCPSGADYWAKKKAAELRREYIEAPAAWITAGKFDKSAGMKRNRTVAKVCTHMVAFWDGKSSGTRKAIEEAMKLNKPVWIVYV